MTDIDSDFKPEEVKQLMKNYRKPIDPERRQELAAKLEATREHQKPEHVSKEKRDGQEHSR